MPSNAVVAVDGVLFQATWALRLEASSTLTSLDLHGPCGLLIYHHLCRVPWVFQCCQFSVSGATFKSKDDC